LDQSLFVDLLTFSASGYTVSSSNGATLILNPVMVIATSVSVTSGVNGGISAPVQLSGSSGSRQSVNVDSFASLTISGNLSGTSGVSLGKAGTGLLTLSGANTGFAGSISVDAGVLQLGSPTALGAASSGVAVQANAALDLNGQVGVANPLTLNGPGIANDGALTNTNAATASVSASVQLATDTYVGGGITISGQVSDAGAGHQLFKVGNGPLTLSNPAGNLYRGATIVNAGTLVVTNTSGSGTGIGPVMVNGNAVAGTNGSLAGTGIITGAVTVTAGGAVRGGDPTAPLAATNRVLTLNGGMTVLGGSTVQAAFTSSGGVVTTPTRLQFAGGINLGTAANNLSVANQLLLDVTDVAGSGLPFNQPVALTLASGTGGFSLNGLPAPATIDPSLYAVTFHGFSAFPGSVSLVTSGSNLVLNFNPVPEPASALGLGTAGSILVCVIRRGRAYLCSHSRT
jgi:autotransporter-associated beta strand protein